MAWSLRSLPERRITAQRPPGFLPKEGARTRLARPNIQLLKPNMASAEGKQSGFRRANMRRKANMRAEGKRPASGGKHAAGRQTSGCRQNIRVRRIFATPANRPSAAPSKSNSSHAASAPRQVSARAQNQPSARSSRMRRGPHPKASPQKPRPASGQGKKSAPQGRGITRKKR